MSDADGTCEYVLDPDDPETWGGEEGDECYVDEEFLNEDGVWTCPHDAEDGAELCIFHLPVDRKKDVKIETEFLTKLRESDGNPHFFGSVFDGLNIVDTSFDIEKTIRLSHSRFSDSVKFDDSDIKPYVIIQGGVFESSVSFEDVDFWGTIDVSDSTFRGPLNAKNSDFNFFASFQNCEFDQPVVFERATFSASPWFDYAIFRDSTSFRQVIFESGAEFSHTTFNHSVNFNHSRFKGQEDPFWSKVEHEVIDDSPPGKVYFNNVDFGDEATFMNVRFWAETEFEDSKLTGISLRDAGLKDASLKKSDLSDAELVGTELKGANLERAIFNRSDLFGAELQGAAFYGAVFGDAQINEETEFGNRCVYDPEFSEVPAADIEDDETGLLTKAAGQYRIIEQLARTNAFPDMVSHNFIRRQDIHREQHRQKGRWGRWLRATASKYILEYGENPWRLIATGLIIVVGFGLLYPLVGGLQPTGGSPITASRVIENPLLLAQSIYYSTLTFTTLGMGDFLPVGLGRVLTTLETSLGAIIIALLVFVFGRRAAR